MSKFIARRLGTVLGFAILSQVATIQAQEQPPPPPPPETTVVVVPAPEPPPAPAIVVVPAQEPQPPIMPVQNSSSQVTETRSGHTAVITGGAVAFGVSYGAAVIVAATSDRSADRRLYIPVLGPWLDIGDRGSCDINKSSCDGETTNKVLLVIDGVFQGAGLIAVVGGIVAPDTTYHSRSSTTTVSRFDVVPASLGRGAPGFVAFGRF